MYFVFFNDTTTTEIYTLSLHDALPIWRGRDGGACSAPPEEGWRVPHTRRQPHPRDGRQRSEEHTSELQSRQYLVCRLLLEKKKIQNLLTRYFISRNPPHRRPTPTDIHL